MPSYIDQLDRALCTSVIDTLENMAFLEVVTIFDSNGIAMPEDRFKAVLSVEAPVRGKLKVRMGDALARKLAENIFGTPHEELDEQLVRDTVAEILNIVAGRFMTALLPGERAYQLGLPGMDQDAPPPPEGARKWLFRAEEEFFTIFVAGEDLLALSRSDRY